VAALALAIAVLAACGPQDGELAELRDQVDALQQGEAATHAQVQELAAELEQLRTLTDQLSKAAVTDRLDRVEDELDDLDTRLGDLLGDQEADAAALADLAADTAASTGDLRSRAAALEAALVELRGQLDEVRTLTLTLRDRLDRLQRGS